MEGVRGEKAGPPLFAGGSKSPMPSLARASAIYAKVTL